MKRIFSIIIGSMLVASATWAQSKVYVTRDLSPESLVKSTKPLAERLKAGWL